MRGPRGNEFSVGWLTIYLGKRALATGRKGSCERTILDDKGCGVAFAVFSRAAIGDRPVLNFERQRDRRIWLEFVVIFGTGLARCQRRTGFLSKSGDGGGLFFSWL